MKIVLKRKLRQFLDEILHLSLFRFYFSLGSKLSAWWLREKSMKSIKISKPKKLSVDYSQIEAQDQEKTR